eukprot:304137-Chlamydomonas_euryale.AAC.1
MGEHSHVGRQDGRAQPRWVQHGRAQPRREAAWASTASCWVQDGREERGKEGLHEGWRGKEGRRAICVGDEEGSNRRGEVA